MLCACAVQRSVTRLPAPYGSCEDPSSFDTTKNAYADFYPVKYTASVWIMPPDVVSDTV